LISGLLCCQSNAIECSTKHPLAIDAQSLLAIDQSGTSESVPKTGTSLCDKNYHSR
jgi:hypothetical protein